MKRTGKATGTVLAGCLVLLALAWAAPAAWAFSCNYMSNLCFKLVDMYHNPKEFIEECSSEDAYRGGWRGCQLAHEYCSARIGLTVRATQTTGGAGSLGVAGKGLYCDKLVQWCNGQCNGVITGGQYLCREACSYSGQVCTSETGSTVTAWLKENSIAPPARLALMCPSRPAR